LTDLREVRALWVILPYQPIRVLISTALARAVGITKVDLHTERLSHSLVIGELAAFVQCQRFNGTSDRSQQANHRIGCYDGFYLRELARQKVTTAALN